ncbi:colicin immunity domain-containing protein [Streptomyces sp. NPDC126503]|uniref:colicin immunity domain-containing protein n=1 Tax=Streptomyces sp. NPDC126503 TaxID=3155315 RepID=UPI00332370A3
MGTQHVLVDSTAATTHETSTTPETRQPNEDGLAGTAAPAILYTPDLQGAVLFPEPGYTLVSGTEPFLAAAVPEGIDAARAQFGRYARTMKSRWPNLRSIAAAHAPAHRAWTHPDEVTPGTATARLMTLLSDFTQGSCAATEFATGWWEARRAAQTEGERASGDLAKLLDGVFMALEDYTPDPDLREPGDLTDSDLRKRIHSIVCGEK